MEVNHEPDDFYMILPSNSNALTHPNNRANDYIVSWETPTIIRDVSKWRVGLTEMTYCYCPLTADRACGISVWKKKRHHVYVTFNLIAFRLPIPQEVTITKTKVSPKQVDYEFPHAFLMHKRLQFESSTYFELTFASEHDANKMGFTKGATNLKAVFNKDSQKYELLGHDKVNHDAIGAGGKIDQLYSVITDGVVAKIFTHYYEQKFDYHLDKEHTWTNTMQMITDLNNKFKSKYFDLALTDDRVQLVTKKDILRLEFLSGFNYVLGFHKRIMENMKSNKKYVSQHPPHLDRGFTNMYIYSSICAPIQVGNARAPLLKSIWIDVNSEKPKKRDEIRYLSIKHPMYVPISTSTINNIQVNIRTDSGILVPFVDSAVTSLTLHFKKL